MENKKVCDCCGEIYNGKSYIVGDGIVCKRCRNILIEILKKIEITIK